MKKLLILGLAVGLLVTGCQQAPKETTSDGEETKVVASTEASTVETEDENEEKNPVSGVQLENIEAVDLNGNPITAEQFKASKITVLNLWGTFCGPCIEEMPDLEALSKEYDAKEVQVIGLLVDGENKEEAKKIVEQLSVTYTTIIPDETLMTTIINKFDYVPATLFVDSEGKVLNTFIPGSAPKEEFEVILKGLL